MAFSSQKIKYYVFLLNFFTFCVRHDGKCVTAISQLFFFAELIGDSRKDLSLETIGQAVLVEQTFFLYQRHISKQITAAIF